MAYTIAQPCIGTKDRACVEVCPVQCFYENEDQLLIHPQECVDCDACKPVCPVAAIFPEAEVPEEWKLYIRKAVEYFAENPGASPAIQSYLFITGRSARCVPRGRLPLAEVQ